MPSKVIKLLIFFSLLLGSANYCLAGFGVSPPYVSNDNLMPGSHYEQRITLVRSDIDSDKVGRIDISINAPEIASWITIDKGMSFEFPAGQKFVYMTVKIDVPANAEFKSYRGDISASLVLPKGPVAGGSAVSLGVLIEVNLLVGEKVIRDFAVYSLRVPDVRQNYPIQLWLGVDNKGNAADAPDKVTADIYDVSGTKFIKSLEGKPIDKAPSFTRQEVRVPMQHDLAMGSYWADLKVYKGEEIVRKERVIFNVIEPLEEAQVAKAQEPEYLSFILNSFKANPIFVILLIVLIILEIIIIILKLTRKKPEKEWPYQE